jgi:hypothetical protein
MERFHVLRRISRRIALLVGGVNNESEPERSDAYSSKSLSTAKKHSVEHRCVKVEHRKEETVYRTLPFWNVFVMHGDYALPVAARLLMRFMSEAAVVFALMAVCSVPIWRDNYDRAVLRESCRTNLQADYERLVLNVTYPPSPPPELYYCAWARLGLLPFGGCDARGPWIELSFRRVHIP